MMVVVADESRKEEIERTNQEQLREQREGKGEWKQGLASESESVVSANIDLVMRLGGGSRGYMC